MTAFFYDCYFSKKKIHNFCSHTLSKLKKTAIAFVFIFYFLFFSTGRPASPGKLKDQKDTRKKDLVILLTVSGCVLLLLIVVGVFLLHKLVKIKTTERETRYENCPQRIEAVSNDYQDFKSCTRL